MSQFEPAVEKVLLHEGGYNFIEGDAGGETNWGISKRSYPNLDIRNLTREQAIEIYRTDWWDKHGFSFVEPQEFADKYFSFAVNMGFAAANKLYLEAKDEPDPLLALIKAAVIRYARICQKNPTQLKFLVGWINRSFS